MGRAVGMLMSLIAAVGICVPRTVHADPVQEPLVDRVRTALDTGVRFLRKKQSNQGDWENANGLNIAAAGRVGGTTCLSMLALLNAGVRPDDPAIQRGLEWMRQKVPFSETYVVGLETMVYAEVGDPRDLPRIQKGVDWLIEARIMQDDKLLGWSYYATGGTADNSNSQYALLGLYAGKQAGAKIDRQVWASIFHFYVDTQVWDTDKRSRDQWGGWIYSQVRGQGLPTSLTMTIAGLCGVEISAQEFNESERKLNADGSDPKCGIYPETESIRRALEWLGEGDAPWGNRFRFLTPGQTFYNIYGIERAGRLTGRRLLAGHDWYREGCELLVGIQHEDGAWYLPMNIDSAAAVSTSFALLFLSKGRTPILISKFAHDPNDDWNNKHHDARHLAEFASKELFKRQPLAWQVYDSRKLPSLSRPQLREEVGTLLQSPILYMNGHEAPRLTPIQKKLLRDYLDDGGFLLAEACCGREHFKTGFRALMAEIYPENGPNGGLAPLRPDHPIWAANFAIAKEFQESIHLEGIEQGCKTIVIFSPEPLAGYWEIGQWVSRTAKLEVPASDRATQAFRLAGNIIAYATGMEMPKPRLTKPEVLDDRDDHHVQRGFLKVAQLKHEGDWQPAPRAMTHLMQFMRNDYKLDVTLQKDDLPISSQDVWQYKFLYMHGRKAFEVTADQVRKLAGEPQDWRAAPGGRLLRQTGVRHGISRVRQATVSRRQPGADPARRPTFWRGHQRPRQIDHDGAAAEGKAGRQRRRIRVPRHAADVSGRDQVEWPMGGDL